MTVPYATTAFAPDDLTESLIDIQRAVIAAGLDIAPAIDAVLRGIAQLLPRAEGAFVQLCAGDDLILHGARGIRARPIDPRTKFAAGPGGWSMIHRRPLLCDDAARNPFVNQIACRALGIGSLLAIPLIHRGAPAGLLTIHSRIPGTFDRGDLMLAELIAGLLLIAIGTCATETAIDARSGAARRFEAAFDHAPVGIAQVSPDGKFLRVNDQFCTITGNTRETLLHDGFERITHPDDLTTDLAHVRDLLAGNTDRYVMEKRYLREDRGMVWANLTVSLVRDEQGAPEFFVAVIEDASDIKRAQTEALVDPLTGLFNRRGLMKHLSKEVQRARRDGEQIGILYLDLDGFKQINDRHGHGVGDRCLIDVAEAIRGAIRAEDYAARIGGDEFVVIASHASPENFTTLADRLRAAIAASSDGQPWSIGVSCGGLQAIPRRGQSAQDLIDRADAAMFDAKRQHRGRVRLLMSDSRD